MDVFINIVKSIFYSLAVLIGMIFPATITAPVSQIQKTTMNVVETIESQVEKIDNFVGPKTTSEINLVKSTTTPIKKTAEVTSPPIVVNRVISEADRLISKPLNAAQIFILTNREREKLSLSPLMWNEKLAMAADIKNRDMISRQYFAHDSPQGRGIEYLASTTKYNYSLIGENLAMGDFVSSEDVVNGWMNSPGHRANILKPAYTEIGISALIGDSNGHNVWYATQEFGRPAPSCAVPDVSLESLIKSSNSYYKELSLELAAIKSNIENGNFGQADVKSLIDQYNFLVNKSNVLLDKIRELISSYNSAVKLYNDCIERERIIIDI